MKHLKTSFALLLMASGLVFGSACGDPAEDEDEDAAACVEDIDCGEDGTCNDGVCEGPGEGCTVGEDCNGGEVCNDDGDVGVCEMAVCLSDDDCGDGQVCDVDTGVCEDVTFRFVMVEDNVQNPSGETPGSDIDAISLIKVDGRELFASDVEASAEIVCEDNTACDPNAVKGAPDAINVETGECFGGGPVDPTLFTSLNGGNVIVSFGGEVIENGDAIHVFEIGRTECGRFDDDAYGVSISATDDFTGNVVQLGTAAEINIVEVSGLP
jgi:hypothetical protein